MKPHGLLALAVLAAPAHAGSCGSAAKVVIDVFQRYKAEVDQKCA